MEKAQNAQRSNSEWKALPLEKEQKQGYNRRKHGQRDSTMHLNDRRRVQDVEQTGRTEIGAAHLHLPGNGLLIV
eukprot:3730145-Amphidinium_carterae.1